MSAIQPMTQSRMIMPRQPMPLFDVDACGLGVSGVDAGVSLIML
jgi:hypothetical protein